MIELLLAIAELIYELTVIAALAALTLLAVGSLVWIFDQWLRHSSVKPATRVQPHHEQPVDFAAEIDDHLRVKDRHLEDVALRRAA